MKRYIYLSMSCLLAMASCTNYFDEKQLDNHDYHPSDVRTSMTYTLTDDDVAQIGKQCSYKGNDTVPSAYEQKALSLCTADDSTAYEEWKKIASLKAFTENASPDLYVPMFMASKFPYLDAGTICNVTYPLYEGKSSRVEAINASSMYTLNEEDYRSIWGGRGASYINADTESKVADLLATTFPTAPDGKIMIVTYEWQNATPDTIYPALPYVCTVSQLLEAQEKVEHQLSGIVGTVKSTIYGRFYLKDAATNDSIYVYGLTDEEGNRVWSAKGIQKGDVITLKGNYSDASGEPQIVNAVYINHGTPSGAPARMARAAKQQNGTISVIWQKVDGVWQIYTNDKLTAAETLPKSVYDALGETTISDPSVLLTYLHSTYLYPLAKQIYLIAYQGKNGYTADEFIYDGTEFILQTGYTTDVMSFVRGDAWVANISTYYTTPFVGDGQADFEIYHVNLDGLSYVWRYQAAYGMTASAYVSGTNHPVEDWLVSPKIRLKKSEKPYLTFMHAVRYGNEEYNKEWLKVMVTNNFTGDVTATEWEHLEFPDSIPDGSNWTFLSTGKFDLSKYNNESIWIAFQYNTTTGELTSAPTWEIQQLLVAEEVEEEQPAE